MTFERPEILSLLGLPVVAAWLFWRAGRRRRAILAAFAAPESLAVIAPAPEGRFGARTRQAVRLCACLACLVAALAGPRWGRTLETVEGRGADLMLVLDVSRSMLAKDVSPDRLTRAKRKILDLLERLAGDKVGLVAFAGAAFVQCPLTADMTILPLFLETASPDAAPLGGSDPAAGLTTALSAFDFEDGAEKAVFLLTDGDDPDPAASLAAAQKLAKAGVRLFCLGFGDLKGAPVPGADGGLVKDASGAIVHVKLEEEALRRLALAGGGAYVRATDDEADLRALYDDGFLAGGAGPRIKGGRFLTETDRTAWFTGAAALLLALDLFGPLFPTRRRKEPPAGPSAASEKGRGPGMTASLLLAALLAVPARAPASPAALVDAGLEAYQAADHHQALAAFEKALAEDPGNPAALFNAGAALYRLDRQAEAADRFGQAEAAAMQRLRALDPKSQAGRDMARLRQQALYNLGDALFRQNDLAGAEAAFDQAATLDPDDRDALWNLELTRRLLEKRRQEGQNKPGQGEQKAENRNPDQKNNPEPGQGGPDQPQPDGKEEAGPDRREPDQAPPPEAAQRPGPSPQQEIDEAMLNRVKDLAGAPMPPQYRKRVVERDW